MNIASFYDVDGDGKVDYEVWGNVASGGWGSSYFDDVQGSSGYGDDASVFIQPEGDEVVFRFPVQHIASARRFRWSVASEWGRYQTIGALAAVQDDMPNDNAAAVFPASST